MTGAVCRYIAAARHLPTQGHRPTAGRPTSTQPSQAPPDAETTEERRIKSHDELAAAPKIEKGLRGK